MAPASDMLQSINDGPATLTLTSRRHGAIISAMSSVCATPLHLRPVELWRLPLADGAIAHCVLGPTTYTNTVVWYLNDLVQDAAGVDYRADAERSAEDVRRMLTAQARA
jgi:hypothetical protein